MIEVKLLMPNMRPHPEQLRAEASDRANVSTSSVDRSLSTAMVQAMHAAAMLVGIRSISAPQATLGSERYCVLSNWTSGGCLEIFPLRAEVRGGRQSSRT